ncbi:uncharacterized protein B0H18DRAFT_950292 [Fomitopsis serialis]|uniref:uncharacterized protein n=1 Tax=Fomitopsis serialis TaxID=139415 RepID=UPI002007AE57|nr:uncharacterized protein B0H18DRAFT_950292 [Neoantrodia serialis]KAH9937433.1 hypothetical protein B0H18DRAFT_950292 [Neoantrodia serialis]
MRSPVIAFSILAAAVSPSLVAGAPTSPNPNSAAAHSPRQFSGAMNHLGATDGLPLQPPAGVPAVPATPGQASKALTAPSLLSGIFGGGQDTGSNSNNKPDPTTHRQAEQQQHNPSSSSLDAYTSHARRASDQNTAGGNGYTGATSDTSGGSVVSVSHGGDEFEGEGGEGEGEDTLTNDGNTGGAAGEGFSGFSYGGDGDGKGAGGNAYSGAVGPSEGGDVVSASDHGIDNTAANAGGVGGFDESGDAQGGDAAGNIVDGVNTENYTRRKRAQDSGTAGGNAYTGASSDVDGGNVINHSDEEGETFNDAAQTGGDAGETYSGEANGGEGDGFGPGGNAYSGATGSAVGGTVVNDGGFVENEDTVTGGEGGESESGDAEGGDA